MNAASISAEFQLLQDQICEGLQQIDGKTFLQDLWERPGGGGGRTRILQGNKIEKGGVNYSAVYGDLTAEMQQSLGMKGKSFYATGVSIVLHPHNPLMPIIHMNIRYFETAENEWWFGGGIDLTPHYIEDKQARFFHLKLKETCDQYNPAFYPKFKEWADNYFYIPHRNETRGIGGIFFDRLGHDKTISKEKAFEFTLAVGRTFLPIYLKLAEVNFDKPFTKEERDWQLIRRGRYVEFNLVWDRGTKFGLHSNGRTESILMSLPGMAKWEYNHVPDQESKEALTLSKLKKGIDWITDK